ncbi:hypothetical protein NW768_002799 [Fusarium equiseti]|uniref:RanBP2-type domain-containing protein n=1 Tax=Fusarium equiseti TaxID=61235 RepID=A0ABQ8RK75_FUSEQ|nr:hypothetical protein NW768_002799 [Fusarium equiseti]
MELNSIRFLGERATASEVKDNRHAVPDFNKWICKKCGKHGNKMKNTRCSRCWVKRVRGTVAEERPPGAIVWIIWKLMEKDDNGNENWEWCECYDFPSSTASELMVTEADIPPSHMSDIILD